MPVQVVKIARNEAYVEIDKLPIETECFLLFLTNRELHILSRFLLPFATWRNRLVRWLSESGGKWPGALFHTATDQEFSDYLQEIDQLSLKLEGDNVSCKDIADGLQAIAAAIAGEQPGSGCTVNVACTGGTGTLSAALAGIPDADYLPAVAQTPPDEGIPPAGFATWAEYRVWKCQAAQAIWMTIDHFMMGFEDLNGTYGVIAKVAPVVAALAIGTFVVLPPAALVFMMSSVIALVALESTAPEYIGQMRAYWATNRDAIVCELYDSGTAAIALTAVGNRVEDAVQAIEWGEVLGPIAPQLAGLIGGIFSQVENNSLVNPLFRLTVGIATVGLTCPCSEAPAGYYWHFDTDTEGWVFDVPDNNVGATFVHSWENPGINGARGGGAGESDGQLQGQVSGGSGGCACEWSYWFPEGYHPVATTGMVFYGDTIRSIGDSSSGYITIWYDDDSLDNGAHNVFPGWGTASVAVTAPNVGKRIKRLALYNFRGSGTDTVTWTWDWVRLVP